jgi:hypothetical protein
MNISINQQVTSAPTPPVSILNNLSANIFVNRGSHVLVSIQIQQSASVNIHSEQMTSNLKFFGLSLSVANPASSPYPAS